MAFLACASSLYHSKMARQLRVLLQLRVLAKRTKLTGFTEECEERGGHVVIQIIAWIFRSLLEVMGWGMSRD